MSEENNAAKKENSQEPIEKNEEYELSEKERFQDNINQSTSPKEKRFSIKHSFLVTRICLCLSVAYLLYEKYILSLAEEYPKIDVSHISTYNGSQLVSFCSFYQSHSLFALAYILATISFVFYIFFITRCIRDRKINPKFTLLRAIISAIATCIILYQGALGNIQCTMDQTWKPILYLYPEETTKVEVTLEREDLLKTTYPKYKDGWKVEVHPDGSMYDEDGNYYYALYWDEIASSTCEFEDGFYVTRENATSFLEEKLTYIGLNEKERNEFIMYWLPVLEENGKNIVQFDLTEELEKNEKINITPPPDSLLRVHINIKKVTHKVKIKEQTLVPFERKGFVAVEWGGTIY